MAKSFNRVSIPIPEVIEDIHEQEAILQAWYFSADFQPLAEEFKEELRFGPWLDFGADIVPLNGSKAEGIKQLVNHLKEKPKRVIAFGDGYNDIEMLQLADIGVAMGNASDEVSNMSGLAPLEYIEQLLDEKRFDEAESLLLEQLQDHCDLAAVYNALAIICIESYQDYRRAKKYYREAIHHQPDSPTLYFNLAILYEQF